MPSHDHHDKLKLSKKTIRVTMKDTDMVRAIKRDGRYHLPWESEDVLPTGWENFKFFFTPSESGVPDEKTLDAEPLMQRMEKDPARLSNPPDAGIRTTWLGHGSVLFQCDGVNILSNPNFDMRGIKYYHPGDNKRYRAPVYDVKDLPRIDIVCISNTHFDLLDLPSIRALNEQFGDMILWYVPLGVLDWMNKAGCTNVIELDWWKEDHVEFHDHMQHKHAEEEDLGTIDVKVVCTPSQNFHSRTTDDDNAVLWCSWVIHTPRYKLFMCGSTGYCDIFKVIGNRYGPFHISAIPIGGYHPREKFGYSNVSPEQAVEIHRDLLSMCSVATTWGTFDISNEHFMEPPTRLNAELKRLEMSEMQFFLLKSGESRLTEIKEAPATEDGECNAPQLTHVTEGDHCDIELEVESDSMLQQLADNLIADSEADAHLDVDVGCDADAECDASAIEAAAALASLDFGGDIGEDVQCNGDVECNGEVDGEIEMPSELVAKLESSGEAEASSGFSAEANVGGFSAGVNVNVGFGF